MATITSAGVGSGLDLESIITATVDAENLPKLAILEKKESSLEISLTALGQIKSDLSSFEDFVDKLNDIDNFNQRTANVIQPEGGDTISVSPDSTATAGNYEIVVEQLAQGSRAVQDDAAAFSSTTDIVTTAGGTLTFQSGTKTFDITLAANATLEDLRTAINESADNFGVSANIINTGGGTSLSKLVFTTDETGTGNDLTVTNNNAELDNVSTTAFGGGAGGMNIAVEDQAQDAIMYVDGIKIQSSTNTFTDAIQDTTITVLKEDINPATLKVETDKESVEETIKGFVDSFNKVMDTLNTAVTSRVTNGTARGLRNALINQVGSFIPGAGKLETIYDLGISLDKDNKLEISSSKLSDALAESFEDIGTLFASDSGVGSILTSITDVYLKSGGVLKSQENALELDKKDVEQEKLNHEYRIGLYEKGLREKYANLDVLIAQLTSQGSAASAALANLPGFAQSK
ncbi:flagellar filament capping protein FliD [Pseudoalteromonas shioyasakiensis]|uniref:flagellar filament capping protein FliD n=1 Tax=Pseudoalteromonas shioyasakiensis TaxID=1190813 RepID=UPI002094F908|nr:flagellar filament capping protein FliD [Pseudoalteromonas shioyasakiensis]MCO6354225.1 flagellar filament capping protein FliD [Pseudoalteromonas shioyasakiensis]